jgi:hypothetical protein
MVFHGVSEYAECDGNERGKRRRGGDPAAFWWFNLRQGLFCVMVSKLRSVKKIKIIKCLTDDRRFAI